MSVVKGSLRLRLLVAVQRPLGLMPYRRDGSLGQPRLSVPLFLGSIFMCLSAIPATYFLYTDIYKNLLGQNVGSVAFGYSTVFMQVSLYLGLFGLFLRSHNLCHIETQVFGIHYNVAPFSIFFAPFLFSSVYFVNLETSTYLRKIFMFLFAMSMMLQEVTAVLLLTELFPFLLRTLRTSVTELSANCRGRINPKFIAENISLDASLAPLFELEQKIHFFRSMREKAASYFFSFISSFLLTTTIMLITSVFALLNESPGKVMIIAILPSAFIFLGLTCKIRNDFTKTVDAGIDDLRDLSCSTTEQRIKQQLSHLISFLTPLRSLDMDGWYTLNYNSLLQIMETVVTYLVIMLQVGWNPLNKE